MDIYEKINDLYDRKRKIELGGGDARIEKQTEEIQITIIDTEWTESERDQMCQHGYDDMDMLRAWLS